MAAPALVFIVCHGSRILAARWLGFPPSAGQHFLLHTVIMTILSYYRGVLAIKQWNASSALSDMFKNLQATVNKQLCVGTNHLPRLSNGT
jgi:hypothetical protein